MFVLFRIGGQDTEEWFAGMRAKMRQPKPQTSRVGFRLRDDWLFWRVGKEVCHSKEGVSVNNRVSR